MIIGLQYSNAATIKIALNFTTIYINRHSFNSYFCIFQVLFARIPEVKAITNAWILLLLCISIKTYSYNTLDSVNFYNSRTLYFTATPEITKSFHNHKTSFDFWFGAAYSIPLFCQHFHIESTIELSYQFLPTKKTVYESQEFVYQGTSDMYEYTRN
jgi:hypothetical protein